MITFYSLTFSKSMHPLKSRMFCFRCLPKQTWRYGASREGFEGNNFGEHCQEGAKVTEREKSIKIVILAKLVITAGG